MKQDIEQKIKDYLDIQKSERDLAAESWVNDVDPKYFLNQATAKIKEHNWEGTSALMGRIVQMNKVRGDIDYKSREVRTALAEKVKGTDYEKVMEQSGRLERETEQYRQDHPGVIHFIDPVMIRLLCDPEFMEYRGMKESMGYVGVQVETIRQKGFLIFKYDAIEIKPKEKVIEELLK
jgi:hypothetical protein